MVSGNFPAAINSAAYPSDGNKRSSATANDAVSAERQLAISEVGAAITHQLMQPMTALLLYMHQIHWVSELRPGPAQSAVEGALRETERLCRLMTLISDQFEAPIESETAVAYGREMIRWWIQAADRLAKPVRTDRPANQRLTRREREVLDLICKGVSNKEGAALLKISRRTMEFHRARIMEKLGAKNTAQLIQIAMREEGEPPVSAD
jgi:DNA-binding CsgD family transcriptional regulator